MSRNEIAIIDYQMGNLRSVQKALEHVGANAIITDCPNRIAEADKLILPGVGAFGDAMRELNARNLPPLIKEAISAGKPFLASASACSCFSRLDTRASDTKGSVFYPAMSFALLTLKIAKCRIWVGIKFEPNVAIAGCSTAFRATHTLLCAFVLRSASKSEAVWLSCEYGDRFCASIWQDNLFATQFHPEKSQRDGLKLLENFAKL